MLVLTVKKDEDIYAVVNGVEVRVVVLQRKGDGVKLGIDAPKSVHVLRGALHRQVDSGGESS